MDSSEPALNFLGRTESTSTGEIGASIFSLPTSVRVDRMIEDDAMKQCAGPLVLCRQLKYLFSRD